MISYVNIVWPVLAIITGFDAIITGFDAEYELAPDLATGNEEVKATCQVGGQIRNIRHDMNLLTQAIGGSFDKSKK